MSSQLLTSLLYLSLICFHVHSLFPKPGLPDTSDCSKCDCSPDTWTCNIKCVNQQSGTREICGLEELKGKNWIQTSDVTLQKGNNFCQEGLLINDFSHFGVGNFFQPLSNLNLLSSLDCFSLRLGDEHKRQRVTFDLWPSLKNQPGEDFVIFERGNGSTDGRLDGRLDKFLPTDKSYGPEAFATSLNVDGKWTPYYYFSVMEFVTINKNKIIPDWHNRAITYNAFFETWSTVLDFEKFGVKEGQEVTGISIVNLQGNDLIKGSNPYQGEVVFGELKDTECTDDCVSPLIDGSGRPFDETDYDPDLIWLSPFRGYLSWTTY